MNEKEVDLTDGLPQSGYLPLLLALFVGSGCAALIYEIVWFQLLELIVGSSTVSLGILLGTFMGGMCLGSLLLPRYISRAQHPLRVYALMEFGIAAIGLLVLVVMPLIGGLYTSWAGSGILSMLLRGVVAGICLLPPTFLMGATLPAISRWVETSPRGVSWLGFFYGGNIVGAVIGCLVAGFYLLRVHDTTIATFVAVAINLAVASLSLVIAKMTPYAPSSESSGTTQMAPGDWAIYVTIALSGMTALASEVVWTRYLALLVGASVYGFALILAVFLLGLGIGSSVGSYAGTRVRARLALGWCQLLLCAAILWTAYMLCVSLPYWPIDVTLATSPWLTLQMDFLRSLAAVLPPAVLWGASFPLALAALAARGQDPGRLVGGVYAANTVGAIVGSVATSLLLIGWIGTQHSQQALLVISAISGLLVLTQVAKAAGETKFQIAQTIGFVLVAAGMLAYSVPESPKELAAYGRFVPRRTGEAEILYMDEGLTASVAVSRLQDGILRYHNAGKVQASSDPADMRLQRMLGHLTTLMPANQRTFLVIGCGAGVTAGAVSIEPKAESVTIAEIEPLVPPVVSQYFSEYNFDVVRNPKVTVRIDDGRHFLLTTDQKFDGITSDPLDPWVKGAAALYTKEFWEVAKAHLNPGGVVTVFVQLYNSNEEAVKSEIATFFEVFPHGTVWANTISGQGYDVVLLGQNDPITIDVDQIEARLKSPEYARVAHSLSEIGMYSATDLFSTYAGGKADLQPWMANAEINTDRNLRLQYLAGMGLNLFQADQIYHSMIASSRPPEKLFLGSEQTLQALQQRIQAELGR